MGAYVRDIHDKFEELIKLQSGVIRALNAEIDQLKRDKDGYSKTGADLLRAFLATHGDDGLDVLTALPGKKDFRGLAEKDRAANRQTQAKIDEILTTHGDVAKIDTTMAGLGRTLGLERSRQTSAQGVLDALELKYRPVLVHNRTWPRHQQLTAENQADLRVIMAKPMKRAALAMVSGYHRSGFRVLETYQGDIQQDETRLDDLRAEIAAHDQVIVALNAQTKTLETARKQLQSLRGGFISDKETLENVIAAAAPSLKDEAFCAALAPHLPEADRKTLLEAGLKLRNADMLQTHLASRLTSAQKTKSQLEAPMDKLRRARYSNGYKMIYTVDLRDIEKKVKTGAAINTYQITSSVSTREAISSYRTADDTFDMLAMQNMFWMWMLTDMAVDAAFANDALGGVPADTALDLNLDTNNLQPDFGSVFQNGLPDGLSDISGLDSVFNDVANMSVDVAMPDMGSIDMGNMDIRVDVPDISIDTGSISSSDYGGGGGGFDSNTYS